MKMNKIFKKVAVLSVGLTMAIGAAVALNAGSKAERADAAAQLVYTLDGTETGGTNGYATESDITQDGLSWKVTGNTTQNPWRIGGKDLSGVDRTAYSTSVMENTISKVELTVGTASSITVNSLNLIVDDDADFASPVETVSGTFAVSSTITFTATEDWTDCYYKFVFNVSVSGNTNRFVQFISAKFYEESEASLASVELVADGAKTNYVDGDAVSLTGIKAIGHYSDSSSSDVSSSCTITADRATVATGETTITYSAEWNGEGSYTIDDLVLGVTVVDLAVSSVTAQSGFRTSFVEKQKLSFGTGKLKVTYNNGTEPTISPTSSGVSMRIGTLDITGVTHYMTLDDNGKDLIASVGGVDCTIGTLTVTPYDEPENGYWSQVTNYSDLSEDDQVIIVASGHEFAMGKYSTGNNVMAIDITKDGEGKISSSIPGVQVYTLKEGTQNNTFGLFDGENYLMAASASQNQLKVESEISDNSSFSVSASGIVAQGTNTRNVIRYNSNDIIFSCYASTSTVGSLACLYKFTPEAKSEDQLAVEEFCKTALHLDETDTENFIDPNDNTAGSACLGPTGLYEAAKAAYASQINNAERKTIFATSADTLIKWGRDRLTAWALANKEVFDANEGTFTPEEASSFSTVTSADNSLVILITIISGVSLVSLASLLVLKKKRK